MTEQKNIVKSSVPVDVNNLIDSIEDIMVNNMVASGKFELIDSEENVEHIFTPGMYARQITMYPGQRITSKIHLTEHQFIISQGVAIVYDMDGSHILSAPYHGITKPGTRRVLLIPEECNLPCCWTTFHPLMEGETTVEQIENRIIEKRINPLLVDNNIQPTYKINN